MKRLLTTCLLFSLLLIIFHLPATSQEKNKSEFNQSKVEVNIAVANIFAKDNLWYLMYIDNGYLPLAYDTYYEQPEFILGLKLHGKKGAVRMGVNFRYSNITYKNDGGQKDEYKYKNFGSSLYFGYEWHKTFNRVNIYYGFDVSGNYKNYYTKHEYLGSYQGGTVNYETKYHEYSYGLNPLLGFNIFITPHLSVGTEVKFIAEYVSGYNETTSTNSQTDKNNSSGFRTRIGPLGFLSFNIHF